MSSKLRRYIVFHGATYYPGEGMCDFVYTCDLESEAIAVATRMVVRDSFTWSQVFDTNEFKIVKQFVHADTVEEHDFDYANKQINAYLCS